MTDSCPQGLDQSMISGYLDHELGTNPHLRVAASQVGAPEPGHLDLLAVQLGQHALCTVPCTS